MAVDLSNFDNQFDNGISEVSSMKNSGYKSETIIDLCRAPKKPTQKNPNTLGRLAFVPILDRNMRAIHKVEGVMEVTCPIPNPDYDPNDPNSYESFWRTVRYIPGYNYKQPLTPAEEAKLNELKNLIIEYNDNFGQYALSEKKLHYMKAFVVKLASDVSGTIYTDLNEPVVILHKSSRIPEAYESMCKANDEFGKEWRRQVFLPEGAIQNVVVLSTAKADIGYNVKFEVMKGVNTGKTVEPGKIAEWMDYDIDTLGEDLTKFNVKDVQDAIDLINSSWNYQDGTNAAHLASGVTSPSEGGTTQAQPAASLDALGIGATQQNPAQGTLNFGAHPVSNTQATPVNSAPAGAQGVPLQQSPQGTIVL